MTYKEILTLLQAGYTKDEINSMDTGDTDTPDHSASSLPAAIESPSILSQPSSQSGEAVPSSPAVEPEPQPKVPAPADPTQQILDKLTELVRSVQSNNRENADMGGRIIDPHESAINTLRSISDIPT